MSRSEPFEILWRSRPPSGARCLRCSVVSATLSSQTFRKSARNRKILKNPLSRYNQSHFKAHTACKTLSSSRRWKFAYSVALSGDEVKIFSGAELNIFRAPALPPPSPKAQSGACLSRRAALLSRNQRRDLGMESWLGRRPQTEKENGSQVVERNCVAKKCRSIAQVRGCIGEEPSRFSRGKEVAETFVTREIRKIVRFPIRGRD